MPTIFENTPNTLTTFLRVSDENLTQKGFQDENTPNTPTPQFCKITFLSFLKTEVITDADDF
jgi:hypothetical protein